jgi:hypothetical protein
MRTLLSLSLLLLFTALTVVAQQSSPVTLRGYVVDQMCAKGISKKANVMEKAATHTRACALEENCAASGYGIFSEGKYYTFDEQGNATAKKLLEKSKRTKGMYFEAVGQLADGKLTVASLKEASPEKKKEGKAAGKG